MSSPDWLNGFILGQHANSSAGDAAYHRAMDLVDENRALADESSRNWNKLALEQLNIIQAQAEKIKALQNDLAYQSSVAEANKKTGRLVLEELRKIAPNSPLANPERIKKIGEIHLQEARSNHRV
jgi:hypothetical protein